MGEWSTEKRVARLRCLMDEMGVDGYVVPSEDSHQSEYPLAPDRRREYISGFTGSAGYVLVTASKAYLWTDGRYFLQANDQLDSGVWTLCKQGTPDCPTFSKKVKEEVKRLGFDPFVHSEKWVEDLTANLEASTQLIPIHKAAVKGNCSTSEPMERLSAISPLVKEIHSGQRNLVDDVWKEEGSRPLYPTATVKDFDRTGETVQSKLQRVLAETTADILVIGNLSQIAWLLNLRGADVDCSRIFLSYCVVQRTESTPKVILYLKNASAGNRLEKSAIERLEATNVSIREYESIFADLASLVSSETNVWAADDINVGLLWLLKSRTQAVSITKSPVDLMKAVKNSVELEGMRQAHIEDGVALCMGLCWLDTSADLSKETECTVADKLELVRSTRPTYECLSFESIVGVDENGAIIHYRPETDKCKPINASGMLLIDSGAHYAGGTTDVTRTIHLGKPSDLQKEMYTRVLMGHLDLAAVVFPHKTYGCMLDVLARRYLWQIGFNFLHGTGHGVGHSLEVHEAPPNIAYACPPSDRDVHFQAGMVVSNEPGAYLDGQFGIRIESLIVCEPVDTPYRFNQSTPYLGFRDLTMVPYCKKLIKTSLLSPEQIKQINGYHERVLTTLMPYASKETRWGAKEHPLGLERDTFVDWLKQACAPITP